MKQLSKHTNFFFKRKSLGLCPYCKINKYKLNREIHTSIFTPLNEEDYHSYIIWEHDPELSIFNIVTGLGNISAGENDILSDNYTISKLSDLIVTCKDICKFGYNIYKIQLTVKCEQCFLTHLFKINWNKNENKISLYEEYVGLKHYSIRYDYTNNQCVVVQFNAQSKSQYIYFDYIPNLDFKNYTTLEKNLQYLLLLR